MILTPHLFQYLEELNGFANDEDTVNNEDTIPLVVLVKMRTKYWPDKVMASLPNATMSLYAKGVMH